MRLLIDTLVALMLIAILGGVILHASNVREIDAKQEFARAELHRFQQQINLRSVLSVSELPVQSHPATIDPAWFKDSLPRNPFLNDGHPWVEIALPDCKHMLDPPNLIASEPSIASFWYNPHTGVVRMRVPTGIPDVAALELYNTINGTSLTSLFDRS